jgi:urease
MTISSNIFQGDANASIPTVQPVISRPMFASFVPQSCITFVSQASMDLGVASLYGLKKRVEVVKGTRNIGKKDMKHNDATPKMEVDPEIYKVKADGVVCTCEPSAELPLTQNYFLF